MCMTTMTMTTRGWFPYRTVRFLVATLHALVGFYYLVASPPLQLYFEPLAPAGANSVYVPGSGFSGFWYHLGLFSNRNNYHHGDDVSYEYYCYSSGCLSLVLAASMRSPAVIYETARSVQEDWLNDNSHRYDIVDSFLHKVLPDDSHDEPNIQALLPHLHILITTVDHGVMVQTPQTIHHLRSLLLQTTYIPLVTGPAFALTVSAHPDDNNVTSHAKTTRVLDGGFSRTLHPNCEQTWSVPLTWKLAWHTLNPGLEQDGARSFWEMGRRDALQKEGVTLKQKNDLLLSKWEYPDTFATEHVGKTAPLPSPSRNNHCQYYYHSVNRTSDEHPSLAQADSEIQRAKMKPVVHSVIPEQCT